MSDTVAVRRDILRRCVEMIRAWQADPSSLAPVYVAVLETQLLLALREAT